MILKVSVAGADDARNTLPRTQSASERAPETVTGQMRIASIGVVTSVLLSTSACLDAPGVGRAADPSRAEGPAPWGSATTNSEFQVKLALLTDILDGKLDGPALAARVEKDYPNTSADERKQALASITELVDGLRAAGMEGKAVTGPDRDMAFAQLHFSERRFIEAATLASKLLDQDPIYPGARNLLARCFFFLQNRDRTIAELEFVLSNPEHQKNKGEILDALFLLGAAVSETPGMSRENLEKGKGAWETYLKLAPDSPQKEHIEKGLLDIEAGLRGEGPLAQPLVPKKADGDAAAPPNVMGGARSMGSGTGGGDAAVQERRVEKLTPDAPPRDRALAEGLDALDAKFINQAEPKLLEVTAGDAWDTAHKEALVGLGRIKVQQGKTDEALRTFGEVLKRDPEFIPAWHYNGMALMMSGAPAEAVKSWEKILEKDPAYATKFNLQKRIDVAKKMAR
jgi:tetratricopeptide (TPR) repeat protein